ncbi:hypothetical protein ST37_04970 [Vibrio sp. qd031]|nr:hypothetical protein ST37_04970 [Vibrio sp. qd031]
MVLSPLPSEHIYSYLFRSYQVHHVSKAARTIFNLDGDFKQRLGFISYEYIESFVPDIPEMPAELNHTSSAAELEKYVWWTRLVRPVANRSGFLFSELYSPSHTLVIEGKRKAGLYFSARDPDKRYPEPIKYCTSCIDVFIRQFGTAYLVTDWLGPVEHCPACQNRLMTGSYTNAKTAFQALTEIFQGRHHLKACDTRPLSTV